MERASAHSRSILGKSTLDMKRRVDWLLVALLAASLMGNAYLLGERGARQTTIDRVSDPLPAQRAAVGDVLPPISGLLVDGTSVQVDYAGVKPTVLYYFTASCIWCARNAESVRALAATIGPNYRFVAVTTAGASVTESVAKGVPPQAVVGGVSGPQLRAAGLTVTPMTLVVEPGGKIRNAWAGAFTGNTHREIEATFGIKLPLVMPQ